MNNGWTKLSCCEKFVTHEKAQGFIDIMKSQPSAELEFRIVEKKGKFYVEYKLLEKHAL